MQDKLIANIMEGYYQAHPQGEELLKLDLAEYLRLHEIKLQLDALDELMSGEGNFHSSTHNEVG